MECRPFELRLAYSAGPALAGMEYETVQKYCLGPRSSLDLVSIKFPMLCRWAVWPFTLVNPGGDSMARSAY